MVLGLGQFFPRFLLSQPWWYWAVLVRCFVKGPPLGLVGVFLVTRRWFGRKALEAAVQGDPRGPPAHLPLTKEHHSRPC